LATAENAPSPTDVESLPDHSLSDAVGGGPVIATLDVSLSNEIVQLLSEQLYTSPLKAIEELVVNAYDADAEECRVGLLLGDSAPLPMVAAAEDSSNEDDPVAGVAVSSAADVAPRGIIAIYDDGDGMDLDGLRGLWRVGDSPKKYEAHPTKRFQRKSVGKFGIGKLATYAVANRITYITASGGKIHYVRCDFRHFGPSAGGASKPVPLEVHDVSNFGSLLSRSDFAAVLSQLSLRPEKLNEKSVKSWTICLLDDLKPKAQDLQIGRLGWVLRTAMPLKSNFRVYLNGAEQKSSKEDHNRILEFKIGDLHQERIASLNKRLGTSLQRNADMLVEPALFPSGIKGEAIVTEGTLVGKSDALMGRSHGFFVRVRGRVVNLEDPLFHNTPISQATFNRFRADLDIDDLHEDLTAPREGVGVGRRRDVGRGGRARSRASVP
jgi:hypothetical protein